MILLRFETKLIPFFFSNNLLLIHLYKFNSKTLLFRQFKEVCFLDKLAEKYKIMDRVRILIDKRQSKSIKANLMLDKMDL